VVRGGERVKQTPPDVPLTGRLLLIDYRSLNHVFLVVRCEDVRLRGIEG
jgi:hypothetical protein